jgi:MYXO-CTERM domain-containing protein
VKRYFTTALMMAGLAAVPLAAQTTADPNKSSDQTAAAPAPAPMDQRNDAANDRDNRHDFNLGWLGLLGLAGLAGLRRRDHRDRTAITDDRTTNPNRL